MTAGNWRRVAQEYSEDKICGDATRLNVDTKTHGFAYGDFRMQNPHGAVDDSTYGNGVLSSGDLVQGGQCQAVCALTIQNSPASTL